MKTRIFATALICFFFRLLPAASASHLPVDPAVKVVVSAKRIWLVADEMAVKNLTVQVMDQKGKVVLEKNFSSKIADWSLSIDQLPEGSYSIQVGAQKAICFTH